MPVHTGQKHPQCWGPTNTYIPAHWDHPCLWLGKAEQVRTEILDRGGWYSGWNESIMKVCGGENINKITIVKCCGGVLE